MDAVGELDRLIDVLDVAVARTVDSAAAANGDEVEPADAIDRILQSPGRHSQVRSLRDSESFNRLREEMVAGNVRGETAGHALAIVRQLLTAIIGTGA